MIQIIKECIKKSGGEEGGWSVLPSEARQFGDYSTNIAMVMAKKMRKSPVELAEYYAEKIKSQGAGFFEKVEVRNPGFINMWLSRAVLEGELKRIFTDNAKYGKQKTPYPQKINIEFISANPTSELTLGNARGAFLGDVLAEVLLWSGHAVTREYYINNASSSNQIRELGKTALQEGITYKNEYLDSILKKEAEKIEKIKKNHEGDSKETLYGEVGAYIARKIQKDNADFIEKGLGIHMDMWFSEESLYGEDGIQKLLSYIKDRELTYEKDGALWFKTKEYGDTEDRVLVRQNGEPTYFVSDIAYHLNKLKDRGFDTVIDILGTDHHGYAPRIKASLKALDIDPARVHFIINQLVRLKEGDKEVRMSKRRGVFITLRELVEDVGVNQARFFFLMRSPNTHLDFDMALAKEQSSNNPVFYVFYAYVRMGAILEKASEDISRGSYVLHDDNERDLVRVMIKFPDVILETANDYEVSRLTLYAHELATAFHKFYERERVISEDKEKTAHRLTLITCTRIVLNNLFAVMGLHAPEKL
ncbi:MAG: arginine--tRNA ligase [Candidatus Harrisonbacteria bacterium RIFOXYD1_FULL_40_9]|uniref:Arginine--tRNA ligase n=1 Tax=Candidatus Harrisonbacteria bacterium RIFOXYD1_FULL_40_9 TaxID=1798412 RepID=A0A1G1ZYK8_9BACT|nr:MAG: arginine--tRNA ligase [Candidatus Harrisonbacteria bacterium RIFOXYD1_FULL_40_9]